MRLVTHKIEHKSKFGVISKNGSWVYLLASLNIDYKTMQELVETVSNSEKQLLKYVSGQDPYKVRGATPTGEVSLLALIPHPWQDVICLGVSHMAHAEGSVRLKKEAFDGERPYAAYFSKRVNRVTDSGVGILSHRDIVTDLDYEAKLAIIIGREVSHVREGEVKNYMSRYTIINDVSARTLQTRHKQWYFDKGLDGFLPMGPCIAIVGELSYSPKVQVQSRVSGELRQGNNTEQLISDIGHIVSELPRGVTLQPRAIIATGIPAGVDMNFDPPKSLVPEDVVECTIERIGTITNKVTDRRETDENGLFTYNNT